MKIKKNYWYSLLTANLVLVFVYLYLVNQMVLNIAEKENLERGSSALLATVARLESERTELSRRLTIDFAYSLGFEDAAGRTLFARRNDNSGLFSYVENKLMLENGF